MACSANSNIRTILYLILVWLSAPASAEQTPIKEDAMKAVYSFSFGKFAHWPESKLNETKNQLGFCIFGKNPFNRSVIDAFEGKKVKGKILKIIHFESGLVADDALLTCHILYVSQSEKLKFQNIIDQIRYQPILTVSDIPGFSDNGGMITLVNVGDQIQFEINPVAIKIAGLSVSSKLLELAKVIQPKIPNIH